MRSSLGHRYVSRYTIAAAQGAPGIDQGQHPAALSGSPNQPLDVSWPTLQLLSLMVLPLAFTLPMISLGLTCPASSNQLLHSLHHCLGEVMKAIRPSNDITH